MQRGRSILQALGVSWLSLVATVVVQLVQIPVALAHLTAEEFSLFAIYSQLLGYLFIVDFGASSAFTRVVIDARNKDPESYDAVWSSGFVLLLGQALLMLAAVTAVTPLLPSLFHVPADLAPYGNRIFWCLGAVLALRQATVIFALNMWAAQKLASANAIQLVATLLQFGLFVATVGSLRLWAYVLAMLVGSLLPHLCYAVLVRREGLLPRFQWAKASRPVVARILSLGADALWITMFGIIVNASFLVFAGMVLPLHQVAALSVNLKPVQLFAEAVRRIAQTCEPYFANLISAGDLGRFRFGWVLSGKTMLFTSLLGAAVYGVLAPWIIAAWTSPAFVMPAPVVLLLCVIPLRQVLHVQFVNPLFQFMALRKVRLVLLCEAAVYGVTAYGLGRHFGAVGLLAAYFISLPLGALVPAARELARHAGIGGRDFRNLFGGSMPIVAAPSVLVLVSLPLCHAWPFAWAAALAAGLAAGSLWLFMRTALSPDEKAYALSLVRGRPARPAGP
ncbi:MAG TPA: hypothetical protein VIH35_01995 [Kiritimatiellia bacterium]|jgi:O-antigen/teichoic acid export membrane protein